MRKAATIALVLVITAGAVFGFIQTGYFQKAVWVFQGTSFTGPGGSRDGHGLEGGGPEGRRPQGEGREGQRPRDGRPDGQRPSAGPDGHGPNGGSVVSLSRVGWFALIMAFFAMVAVLIDRAVKAAVARRPGRLTRG